MLTTELAMTILAKARAEAQRILAKPVGYAIADAGGHPLIVLRDHRAGFLRATIALNKAWGCLAMGMSGARLEKAIQGYESWFVGLQGAAGGRLMPTTGGIFIRDREGVLLGAMGVSGESSANDLAIAAAGIEGAGLVADNTEL